MADVLDVDLASPFNTPRAQRHAVRAIDIVSPLTPRRPRNPLGPSCLLIPKSPRSNADCNNMMPPPSSPERQHQSPDRTSPETTSTGLNDLPVEQIHKLADNPFLPTVNRYMRSALTNASPTYIAAYMLHQYRRLDPPNILTYALRRRIVDIAVAEEIIRIWDYRRGYVPTPRDPLEEPCTPLKIKVTKPALSIVELPRRLFRPKPDTDAGEPAVPPLVQWIFKRFDPPLASHKNYALNRSALNQNYELVEMLLRRGADPNLRNSFPLRAAIEKKDMRLVRLLVEPFQDNGTSGKKRKLNDRIKITPSLVKDALKNGTEEIVDYFVHEKGAMPPLGDIMALGH